GVGPAGVLRATFDPEALPEHPGSQLVTFGAPLLDRMLADAQQRGRHARAYYLGLNLAPHNLASRAGRQLDLPEKARLEVERVHSLHFGIVVFWFEATFISDQKDQDILTVAIDRHYGRQMRHLDQLLDP